jgi:hypothetical protein
MEPGETKIDVSWLANQAPMLLFLSNVPHRLKVDHWVEEENERAKEKKDILENSRKKAYFVF